MATRIFTVEAVDGRSWTVSAASKDDALKVVVREYDVARKDLKVSVNRRAS